MRKLLLCSVPLVWACGESPCADGYGLAADGNCYLLEEARDGSCDTAPSPRDTGVAPDPWAQEDSWLESDGLQALLDLEAVSAPHWELRYALSSDGESWVAPYTPIAHSLYQVHLLSWGDVLVIVGRVDFSSAGLEGGWQDAPYVFALASTDLQVFGDHAWPVEGAPAAALTGVVLVDHGEEGVRALYDQVTAEDPDRAQGLERRNYIRVATRQGGVFTAAPDPLFWGHDVSDAVTCGAGDTHHLFAQQGDAVIHGRSTLGETYALDSDFQWSGVTAPSCLPWGDGWRVLAQVGEGEPGFAYRDLSADGGAWSEPATFTDSALFDGGCHGPSLAPFQGGWVLMWSAWVE